MSSRQAKRIVLNNRPEGKPQPEDFRTESFSIEEPVVDGGLLLKTEYLSLDPYMRGRMDPRKSYVKPLEIGEVMTGETISKVLKSRTGQFYEGDEVIGFTGWCSHAYIADPKAQNIRKVQNSALPVTTQLGVLGMPGFTAYAGLNAIGKPKAGETVAVAAASGPVGSLVGQLAKMSGCHVIGIAGGAKKCAYVKDELGFDVAIDHKAADFPEQLARACDKGIDVYFENVGGQVWEAVLPLLNDHARVPVCGLIAQYNGSSHSASHMLDSTMRQILSKRLLMQGFINYDYAAEHYASFLKVVGEGIAAGKIKYLEDVTEGLENAPEAFVNMLDGKNFGKQLIKIA